MKQHQFENLLFSKEPLSNEDQSALENFLQSDPEAARLAAGWEQVEKELVQINMRTPQRGFRARWLSIERKDRHKREQIQALWAVLVSALGAVVVAFFAYSNSGLLIPSVIDSLFASIRQALELASFLQILSRVLLTLINKMPLAWWGSIAVSLVLFPALWLVVYREFALAKGVRK